MPNPFQLQRVIYPGAPQGAAFVGELDAYTAGLKLALLPFRGFSAWLDHGFDVRDTVGDAEQEVGFDPVTGDLSAFTVGGSSIVRRWQDQSGNGNHAGMSVAVNQPALDVSLPAFPSVDFDGSSQWLATEASLAFPSGFSLYVVFESDVDGAWQTFWSTNSGTATRIRKRADSNRIEFTTPAGTNNGSTAVGTQGRVFSAVVSGAAKKSWLDSVLDVNLGSGDTMSTSVYRVGIDGYDTWYFNGKISAILAYDAVHDDATRGAIEGILAARLFPPPPP